MQSRLTAKKAPEAGSVFDLLEKTPTVGPFYLYKPYLSYERCPGTKRGSIFPDIFLQEEEGL